jgi:cell division protein FtsB
MDGVLFLIFFFVIFALNSPIAKAIAARIRNDTTALQPMSDARLTEQSARLEALETEVARLNEALDFTQKLLENPRKPTGPGSDEA